MEYTLFFVSLFLLIAMTLALTTKTPTYAFFIANETLFTTTMSSNQCPATEHWGCPGGMCDGNCCNDGVCYTTDDSSVTITDCESTGQIFDQNSGDTCNPGSHECLGGLDCQQFGDQTFCYISCCYDPIPYACVANYQNVTTTGTCNTTNQCGADEVCECPGQICSIGSTQKCCSLYNNETCYIFDNIPYDCPQVDTINFGDPCPYQSHSCGSSCSGNYCFTYCCLDEIPFICQSDNSKTPGHNITTHSYTLNSLFLSVCLIICLFVGFL